MRHAMLVVAKARDAGRAHAPRGTMTVAGRHPRRAGSDQRAVVRTSDATKHGGREASIAIRVRSTRTRRRRSGIASSRTFAIVQSAAGLLPAQMAPFRTLPIPRRSRLHTAIRCAIR